LNKIPLVLALVGCVLLGIGITVAFANSLGISNTIHSTGRIVNPYGESESQTYVDSTGYVPMIVGVGLLSVAILDGKFRKHK
jgi:hypothetical protein